MNKDIVSTNEEDKPLIFISEEAINLKRDNDNYKKEIERLNKCIDEALEIIIKDWNDKCTIPIHSVVDTGEDIRIKLYYQLFLKGIDKQ